MTEMAPVPSWILPLKIGFWGEFVPVVSVAAAPELVTVPPLWR